MIAVMITLFVLGYMGIALEHFFKINKATFALMLCGLLWAIYALFGNDANISGDLLHAFGETCEIVVFLIGAMTIVELIDRYGGFNFIVRRIHADNKRKLMWIIASLTFFMSAVLDNMTTTIIMVMILRRLLRDKKERWIFASVIVLAANAGGAWSPIGDVTTIMLWMKNYVTTGSLVQNLLLPSLVAMLVPTWISTYFIKNQHVEQGLHDGDQRVGYVLSDHHPHVSILVFILGVAALVSVPIFKAVTHLPPYMGIIFSLSILWLITEIIVNKYVLDGKIEGRISELVRNIDMATILFFLGILMAVSALSQAGILGDLALWLNDTFHEVYLITGIIGCLSAVIDNVPLVAACINMYPVVDPATIAAAADPAFASLFVQDGLFWLLLTFCAGFGGSMLIIGSAAGVVAMGIEKISFGWYFKKMSFVILLGYLAGMATIYLQTLIF